MHKKQEKLLLKYMNSNRIINQSLTVTHVGSTRESAVVQHYW